MKDIQNRVKNLIDETTEESLTTLQCELCELLTDYHKEKLINEDALGQIVAICLSLSNEDCLLNAIGVCQENVLARS